MERVFTSEQYADLLDLTNQVFANEVKRFIDEQNQLREIMQYRVRRITN